VRAINGFSEMVLRDCGAGLDPASAGHLRRVIAASRHMGELIDDLLNLARLSRQAMRVQEFDLAEMASAAAAALADSQPARTVRVDVQPRMKTRGDPGLLRAVMDNLIGNAWKFTGRADAPRIEVGSRPHEGVTCYSVRDNGAGFDMHYAHKLFAPFQRLHHADEFEGTGIGLATVRKVIERHGGRVWIESAVNAGTTVYFTLG
jgi:light-regulated signal transduction histidine kinase (bacteriophytochrome)